MSKYLSRDQILAASKREYRDVAVPEWGGTVRLQSLTGTERDEFESSLTVTRAGKSKPNTANFRARLVARSIVDDEGKTVFSPPDVVQLGQTSAAALQRVFDACNEMNNISEEDVSDLTSDFDKEAVAASTSDSPAI